MKGKNIDVCKGVMFRNVKFIEKLIIWDLWSLLCLLEAKEGIWRFMMRDWTYGSYEYFMGVLVEVSEVIKCWNCLKKSTYFNNVLSQNAMCVGYDLFWKIILLIIINSTLKD